MLRDLTQGLLALLYPGSCAACNAALPPGPERFCAACLAALTEHSQVACPRCASEIGPFAHVEDGCSRCRGVVFHFERAIRLGPYEGLLRDSVLRMKHASGEDLAELLGQLWVKCRRDEIARNPEPKWLFRSPCIGGGSGRAVTTRAKSWLILWPEAPGLPCRPRWLRRARYTPNQTEQSATARREKRTERLSVSSCFRHTRPDHPPGRRRAHDRQHGERRSTPPSAQAGAGRVIVGVLAHAL